MERRYCCWTVPFLLFSRFGCVWSSLICIILHYYIYDFIRVLLYLEYDVNATKSVYYNSSKTVCLCCLFIRSKKVYISIRNEEEYNVYLGQLLKEIKAIIGI